MLSKEHTHSNDKAESKKYQTKQITPGAAALKKTGNLSDIVQRAMTAPESLLPNDVLQLQRTIGNSAVIQLFKGVGNGKSKPLPSLNDMKYTRMETNEQSFPRPFNTQLTVQLFKDPKTNQNVDIKKLSYEEAYAYLIQAEKGILKDITQYEIDLLRLRLVTILEMEIRNYPGGKDAVMAAVSALGKTPLKIEWGEKTQALYETGQVYINAPENKNDGMLILIFELTNMSLTKEYKNLDDLAEQGKVDKATYIWENERIELEQTLLKEIQFTQGMLDKGILRKEFGPRIKYLVSMGGKNIGDQMDLAFKYNDPEVKKHMGHYGSVWDKFFAKAHEKYINIHGKKGLYEAKPGTVTLPALVFPEDKISKEEIDKILYGESSEEQFLSSIDKYIEEKKKKEKKEEKKEDKMEDDDDIFK